jgi:SAM-dependent methyltransferase
MRTNGLKRFLYLTCFVIASRWLEPLRRLAVEFVVLPGTRKRQALAPWIAVGLIGTVVMLLWDEAAEVWGKAFELTPVLALVESLWDEALWLLLLVLLAVYFKYVHAKLAVALRVRYWQVHKQELLKAGAAGYILIVERLGLQEERLETLKEELEESREVVIADIDQDGLLLSRYGSIPGAVATAPESFMERKRLALEVVATGDKIGVKKYYRGDKACFLNELECLHTLAGRCNTPAILGVDFANLTLTFSYIPGVELREELSRRGARLLNRDVDGNPDFMHLTREDRRLKCIEEGKRVLYRCVDPAQVDDIFTEMKRAHKAGVCICDVKYGNIIIERDSGEPYLIDFDRSRYYGHSHGLWWEVGRDGDIEQFNLCFNTEKLTRDRIFQRISKFSQESSIRRPSPVDFGHGVAMGRIWDRELGEGRWHTILKPNLPPLSGRRVLDLGCKDTYFLLQTLRHGAMEAVGIEPDDAWSEPAQFIKEGFEWADSATYDPKVIHARIEDVLTMDMGRFDLVTALCTLHELGDEFFDKVIQHISTLTDCFLVQCDTDPEEHLTHLKASVDFNIRALKRNGFGTIRTVAPPGYKRPLLIGTKPV